MNEFYSIITTIGLQKINECLEVGSKLDMKYIAVGDSNGSYYEPTINQTELLNELWRGEISEINQDNTGLFARTVIPFNIGGFYIREVGVFDSNNNLILIGKQPETYKPLISEGSAKDIWLKVILNSINTDIIELQIDPSVQTASVQYVLNMINNHNHSNLMPICLYDTNANGIVDSCEYIDGGIFTDNQQMDAPEEYGISELIMNTTIYDKNNNGIVDEAENINGGTF